MKIAKVIVAIIIMLLLFAFAVNKEEVLLHEGEMITCAYIDLLELDDDEKLVVQETVEIQENDKMVISEVFCNKKAVKDQGLVFAYGGYKLRLATDEGEWELYPYGGNYELVQIGQDTQLYVSLNEEEQKKLLAIIEKYASNANGLL